MPKEKLRVLVVDDNDDDLFLMDEYLSQAAVYDIVSDNAINYHEARKKILQNAHDIYVIDYLLGAETGLDLIRDCVKSGIKKPFILLTGKGDKKIDVEAAKAGVYDYLTKSELNAELLERSFRYSLQRYFSYTAIEESEKRYREIFTKSNDIIFVLNGEFEFINFNPAMTLLLGYKFDELIGKSVSVLFENEEAVDKFLNYVRSDALNAEFEILLFTNSKVPKTFLASLSETGSADGTIQYQGILHDYTGIKKSVAGKLLNARIEATNKIVRSLAHEIRNPLTNINLSSHQLESEIPDDKKVYTEIIIRNSKRINDLIGELMNLSGTPEKKSGLVDIIETIRSALLSATDRIQLKGIEVFENFSAQKIFVPGDRDKIRSAFLNIIINAIEAMETGKGKLELLTECTGQVVETKISDNGVGIPGESLPYLFQPFFTGKKNGMGMGLAIAHSVIQSHNGTIEVDSEPGRGTTFSIKLRSV